jgi:hypothetical protein
MKKTKIYMLLGGTLLLVSMSDLSRYCRHLVTTARFERSAVDAPLSADTYSEASTGSSTDADTSASHVVADILPLDPEVIAQAMALVDTAMPPLKLKWPILADVKYKRKYHAAYGQYFDYPVFGEAVKALNGRVVQVRGYVIPLDVGGLYALSKNPYAACFFCGGAGPETVMGLTFRDLPRRFKTDEYITFEGILVLNEDNVDQFMYQLVSAYAIGKP